MFLAKMAAVKHDIYLGDTLKVLHVMNSILLPPAVEYVNNALKMNALLHNVASLGFWVGYMKGL